MSYVLVINSGSSSIKFQIVDPSAGATDTPLVSGLVEKIGEFRGGLTIKHNGEKHEHVLTIPNHTAGFKRAFAELDRLGCGPTQLDINAVGHRIVHGGTIFSEPVLLDETVVSTLRELIPLAPLHNPANIDGIEVARRLLPNLPHVGVFDTAYFSDLPDSAAVYAIEKSLREEYHIRRYGFHGTSHEFIAGELHKQFDQPAEEINHITLHLGNGASASAVRGGKPIDTSMGMTPLEGLVMGTRCGSIDPGIIFHLYREVGLSIDGIDKLLNKRSGMKGLAGSNDFRDIHQMIKDGSQDAQLALDVYVTQLRRILGSYMIQLGRVDAIAFTAGVGENDPVLRRLALADLENFGVKLDDSRNESVGEGVQLISTDDSPTRVYVVPTNEELAIAQKVDRLVG
ncbi:acetate kinase [Corynebacterium yudongzhengii]|uniref:Acetate kinase n=1 Tax=Corynebacterium yudongzhengii TaxID=2080740 RepID=A0A2U1T4T0_9CORY|nr:acetate kinase [Corynebacterium yudongzhengii]AWB82681.1 acetate kinase [Corynebacterium yudongzhengii]PWC01016.1 acetate kinase [Corynebacterium yudongzhengii]